MKRKRIILPGLKRLKKWFLGLFKVEDTGTEHSPDSTESGGANIYAGTSYEVAKDPEHLPPTNAWQRFSGGLRSIGGFLSSPASGFGLRAACATMSVGIVVYLADTQAFFLDQRLVWAMIMISIGMTTTAGSGIFGFLGRIAGTSKHSFPTTLSALLIVSSDCHVHELCYLVHRRWPHRRGSRLRLRLQFLRILHPAQIPAPNNHCPHLDGNPSSNHRLRT